MLVLREPIIALSFADVLFHREWIGTISSWPSNFKYKDVAEVGRALSQRLRDPDGEYKCDIVIALTHARYPSFIPTIWVAINGFGS